MDNYEILKNDEALNNIIDSINKVNEDNLLACHGRYHTMFVVNMIEYVLKELGFSKNIIELGKIAGLLHDIGVITGKKGHALKSSIMCVQFLDKTNLSQENKEIIIHAIADHSIGKEITSPVGAALILVDKIDISKFRILELGKKDAWHNNLLNLEEVILKVKANKIIINYVVNDKFSKEKLLSEYKKKVTLPIKASKYLGCDCIFEINGKIDMDFI